MDATDRQHPYTYLYGCQSYLYLSQNLIFPTIRCLHRSFPPFLFSFYPNTGAPHTILLLSFPSSLPSSSFTALCFLHSTVQRRHTTAAGKREAEAKKRKERYGKMAQAEGKEQGEGEDGDGMIGGKNEGREAWTGRDFGGREVEALIVFFFSFQFSHRPQDASLARPLHRSSCLGRNRYVPPSLPFSFFLFLPYHLLLLSFLR